MKHLKTCCCQWTLRTGTIIIGIISLVYAISVPLGIQALGKKQELKGSIDSETVSVSGNTITESSVHISGSIQIAQTAGLAVTGVIVALLLLVGAFKEYRWLLMPWIVVHIFVIIIAIIGAVICVVLFSVVYDEVPYPPRILVPSALACFIFIVSDIYFMMVVNGYFHELKKGKEQGLISYGQLES